MTPVRMSPTTMQIDSAVLDASPISIRSLRYVKASKMPRWVTTSSTLYVRAATARMPNSDGVRALASTSRTTICAPLAAQELTDSHRAPRAARTRLRPGAGSAEVTAVHDPEPRHPVPHSRPRQNTARRYAGHASALCPVCVSVTAWREDAGCWSRQGRPALRPAAAGQEQKVKPGASQWSTPYRKRANDLVRQVIESDSVLDTKPVRREQRTDVAQRQHVLV